MVAKRELIPAGRIAQSILVLRGEKVLLDRDLAALDGVETRVLNQAVKRNANRFPEDFAFILSREEIERISQTVTSSVASRRFAELEQRVGRHDEEIAAVIDAIRQLMAAPAKPRREIGFHVREKTPRYRTTRR
jgi:hypothetical protein